MSFNANDFPQVYAELGLTVHGRGVVMLDVPPLEVRRHVANFSTDDVYYADDPKYSWLGGVPGEDESHVTLLYGLLENANDWRKHVRTVLDGWEPEPLRIAKIGTFPASVPGYDYTVIIAELELTKNLMEAHQRLSLLPHIDTFPDYRAHITLAYVKDQPANVDWAMTTAEKWVRSLKESYEGKLIVPEPGINLGSQK